MILELFYFFRENLATPDGGILALDWVKNDENNELYPNPESRPTIVIVPGMTGIYLSFVIRKWFLIQFYSDLPWMEKLRSSELSFANLEYMHLFLAFKSSSPFLRNKMIA